MTHGACLAGQTAAANCTDDVELILALACFQRLLNDHAQSRAGEILFDFAVIDVILLLPEHLPGGRLGNLRLLLNWCRSLLVLIFQAIAVQSYGAQVGISVFFA